MQVAKGIDVEDVGEARRNAQILDKAGEHVPRVALNETDCQKNTSEQRVGSKRT